LIDVKTILIKGSLEPPKAAPVNKTFYKAK